MATVAEGRRQRVYLKVDYEQAQATQIERPEDSVEGEIAANPRSFSPPIYGLTQFSDLFTSRQLVALTTFSDLVSEAREKILADALLTGIQPGRRLEFDGTDAEAYADTVATYLGLALGRLADYGSSIATWMPDPKNEGLRNTFARQAIPMTWDFAEGNPFSDASGNFRFMLRGVTRVLEALEGSTPAVCVQAHASDVVDRQGLLSTDPPYYDNIPYSDLSDYFYVWLRRSLRAIHPALFSTLLVPKSQELVANPYRHKGRAAAKDFFEDGFRLVFAQARKSPHDDFPITVYYAFKQSEAHDDDGDSSSGWETLLDGMIRSGWTITATWPLRSERGGRMVSVGTNALASSIVLALRPRPEDAPITDRKGLISVLQAELPLALRDLQQGAIAPVDLPQAAIGPGMAVFSRYSTVIESDGSPMAVRSALARINEILDQVLNEQEGDFDATTRFAIAWYRQHGYSTGVFGEADNLARARNTSVDVMERDEILTSRAGKVTLLRPTDLPPAYDVVADEHTSAWEALHHLIRLLESDGVPAAGELLAAAVSRPDGAVDADLVKELAFLLFSLAEKNGWTKDALAFNTLATSWPEIVDASRSTTTTSTSQPGFDFDEDE